jgi:hypothetical protein
MIPKFFNFGNKNKGSSLMLPAKGLGGSRATSIFLYSKAAAAPALRALKQKGKKEGGWGEGIFALLRIRIERFRFSLIKRKPKQKIFHLLLKEKRGAEKNMKQAYILLSFGNVKLRFAPFFISLTRLNIKNVMKKFLFWFAVAERRQAETHLIILDSVQKKLEFQPKGTAILR